MCLRRFPGYGLDDWLMVLAAALMVVYEAMLTELVVWGLGRKFESITLHEYKNLHTSRPWFRYFLIFWVVLMAIGAVLANILTFVNIDPLEARWDPTIKPTYRFNPIIKYYTAEGVGWQAAISDLVFGVVPIAFVWKLQMPSHRKIGLSLLLSGTLIAFLASLAKIIFSTMEIRGEIGKVDGPTTGGVLWISSGIEQGLVIILGTLPVLRPIAHMQSTRNLYDSLVYLVTLGRRSSRSSESNSAYNENLEMGQGRGSDSQRGSSKISLIYLGKSVEPVKPAPCKVNGMLVTLDDERNIRLK
ncbi:hypothetical protein QQS21_001741 [Conoideocrella luteorostrata]|uniref:Rhodopsin domain-containing protein n=1 Tax=Conoideocrella luteorostrata TaxID=1105319 RepID=A0AAJ0G1Q9_9HYPO|nr:hypothetical protein QQS21_001741 [Conoideocrella luteorostrata]